MLTLSSHVEVRCHPGCAWTEGWIVCEVADGLAGPEYRVRRIGHDRTVGMLLPAELVRPADVLAISAV